MAISGGNTVGYAYDPFGRLVRRDVNGVASNNFLWEGANLFAELGPAGTSRLGEYSYYPGLDDLHAYIPWTGSGGVGQPQYAHRDALGNVRGLSNQNVHRSYQYDPWGQLTGGTDIVEFTYDRARWKGALRMSEEADLYFMRNRWYEPRTGRFLSEDPIGLDGGLNLYAFASGDPVEWGRSNGPRRQVPR